MIDLILPKKKKLRMWKKLASERELACLLICPKTPNSSNELPLPIHTRTTVYHTHNTQ